MEITVNGTRQQVPEVYTLTHLLEAMALSGQRLAVEVNLDIVPRSAYAQTVLKPGDRVEIVHAIGGG